MLFKAEHGMRCFDKLSMTLMQNGETSHFWQVDTESCAPACTQMAYARFGVHVPPQPLIEALKPTEAEGVPNSNFEGFLRKHFYCDIKKPATVEDIQRALRDRAVVIVNFLVAFQPPPPRTPHESYPPLPERHEDRDGHYGIVREAANNHLLIHDPQYGPAVRIERPDFEQRWRAHYCKDLRWMAAIHGVKKAPE